MGDDPRDWAAVSLQRGAELVVGWRPRRSRLDAAAVELSREVADEIRKLCVATLERLAGLVRRPYGGSPYIEQGEEYLAVPATELPRTGAPSSEQVDDDEAAALSDLERLIATAGLPPVSREELREGKYLFYAVVCTEAAGRQRIGFVRQTDPHRVAKTGGFMARFGEEGLQSLEDPVFIFEAGFDLVVAPDEVAVLRLEAFNRMFADLNTITAAARGNAKMIASSVTGMTPAATQALGAAASGRPSLARRLQRLLRPGALPPVTPEALSEAMIKHGLDPTAIVSDDKIAFAEDDAVVFLDLLEQLYYETDFTGEHRRADRYSPLTP